MYPIPITHTHIRSQSFSPCIQIPNPPQNTCVCVYKRSQYLSKVKRSSKDRKNLDLRIKKTFAVDATIFMMTRPFLETRLDRKWEASTTVRSCALPPGRQHQRSSSSCSPQLLSYLPFLLHIKIYPVLNQ